MKSRKLDIPEVLLIEPEIYHDERGFFLETFRNSICQELDLPDFIQHNTSRSKIGTLRGIHYQFPPQAKLVRCSSGSIYDVAVDLRLGSPSFGKYVGVILDDVKHNQLFIPVGFGHAFLILSESADVNYLASNYYSSGSQMGIIWDDPTVNIDWPELPDGISINLSAKDRNNLTLADQSKQNLFSFM